MFCFKTLEKNNDHLEIECINKKKGIRIRLATLELVVLSIRTVDFVLIHIETANFAIVLTDG